MAPEVTMSRKALSFTVVGGLSIIIVLQLVSLGRPAGGSSIQADDQAALALLDDEKVQNEQQVVEDPRLLAIGALGASHVYTMYGYIGVMADGYVGVTVNGENHRVYSAERIAELTPEIAMMCDNCKTRLEGLRDLELIEEDLEVVNQMIEIYGLLGRQAQALERFVESNSPRDAEEFETIRTTVWPEIARLLGIEE
jgi:hypothetical protein